jgi:hypothetical protein
LTLLQKFNHACKNYDQQQTSQEVKQEDSKASDESVAQRLKNLDVSKGIDQRHLIYILFMMLLLLDYDCLVFLLFIILFHCVCLLLSLELNQLSFCPIDQNILNYFLNY